MISHIEIHHVRWDGETLRWPGASDMCNWHPVTLTTRFTGLAHGGTSVPRSALWNNVYTGADDDWEPHEIIFSPEPLNLLTMPDEQALFIYRYRATIRSWEQPYVDIMHRGRFFSCSQQNFGFTTGRRPTQYIYTFDRTLSITEQKSVNLKAMIGHHAIKWIDQLDPQYLTSTVRPLLDQTVKDGYVGPILADALQDADFDDAVVLNSLRTNNPIWAVFQVDWLKPKSEWVSQNQCGEIAL